MTSAATGAVFFLGTRAHYQALQPPDQMRFDIENGNDTDLAECGWIHCTRSDRSRSNMLLLEYRCDEPAEQNMGVTRRFRGKRTQDGSNERILNEDTIDVDPAGLHNLSYRDSVKSKESAVSGRCASLRALFGNLKRRKRKPSEERAPTHLVCTYRDSCRCIECQSRYFECDESEDGSSDSYNDYDYDYGFDLDFDSDCKEPAVTVGAELTICKDTDSSSEDENEEVFIDTPPDNVSTDALIAKKSPTKEKMSVSSDENGDYEDPLQWDMAAGTPVVLDYLLNHPIMCSIQ